MRPLSLYLPKRLFLIPVVFVTVDCLHFFPTFQFQNSRKERQSSDIQHITEAAALFYCPGRAPSVCQESCELAHKH